MSKKKIIIIKNKMGTLLLIIGIFLAWGIRDEILEKTTDKCFSEASCRKKHRDQFIKLPLAERQEKREKCRLMREKREKEIMICFEKANEIKERKDKNMQLTKCQGMSSYCWASFYAEPTPEELAKLEKSNKI